MTWDDIKGYVTTRIDGLRNALETADDPKQVRYLQGKLAALREVLQIPDAIHAQRKGR